MPAEPEPAPEAKAFAPPKASEGGFSITRLWAYARREAVEIMRDPVRIAFALFNPIILMFAIGYGISFDVEHLRWAVFDQDRSLESRQFLDSFQNPKYFDRKPNLPTTLIGDGERQLDEGAVRFVRLHHHPLAAAEPRVRAPGVDDAAVDDGGREPRRLEQSGGERGGRRLAVRARNRHRHLKPHQLGQHLGALHHRGCARRLRGHHFRIVRFHGGRNNDDGRVFQMLRFMPDGNLDA